MGGGGGVKLLMVEAFTLLHVSAPLSGNFRGYSRIYKDIALQHYIQQQITYVHTVIPRLTSDPANEFFG